MPTENLEHCNSGHIRISLPKNLDASLLIPARIANQNNDRYEFLHSKRVLKVRKSTLAPQPNSSGATKQQPGQRKARSKQPHVWLANAGSGGGRSRGRGRPPQNLA
jgi:hypothetical protein